MTTLAVGLHYPVFVGGRVHRLFLIFVALVLGRLALPFDYEQLKALIENRKLASIEGVLSEMPLALRSRYLLIYDSLSQQYASPAHPRVVLFEDDATFIMAFSGVPRSASETLGTTDFDLEIIQFRQKTRTFDFLEIEFPRPGKPSSVVFRDGVSHPKPESCSTCHDPGNGLRPNWDPYNLWRGIYGSYDDVVRISSNEGDRFARFITKESSHGRYRFLDGLPSKLEPETRQFGDKEWYWSTSLKPEFFTELFGFVRRPDPDLKMEEARPALKFTIEVERLNSLRLGHQLWNHPDLPLAMPALTAAHRCTPASLDALLPQAIRRPGPKSVADWEGVIATRFRDSFEHRVWEVGQAYYYGKDLTLESILDVAKENSEKALPFSRALRNSGLPAGRIAQLQFVLQALGLDVDDWTTSRDHGSYDYRPLSETDPLGALTLEAKEHPNDPRSARWLQLEKMSCEEIEKKFADGLLAKGVRGG